MNNRPESTPQQHSAPSPEHRHSKRHPLASTLLLAGALTSILGSDSGSTTTKVDVPSVETSSPEDAYQIPEMVYQAPEEVYETPEKSYQAPVEHVFSIDCSQENYRLPDTLEAKRAKDAVHNIEFFIDNPFEESQIQESIRNAESNEEIEEILQKTFQSRGLTIAFNQAPGGLFFNREPVELESYKLQMSNMLAGFGHLPKKLITSAKNVYVTNGLWTEYDKDGDGQISDDEHWGAGGMTILDDIVLDSNSFIDQTQGEGIVLHEYMHVIDNFTCAPGFDQSQDTTFKRLRQQSDITSIDVGLDPDAYFAGTEDPKFQEELDRVVSSPYGRANAAEDKATALEPLFKGQFPDQDDPGYDRDSILYEKQRLMMGRVAEFLDIPELAELAVLRDIYGNAIHPKLITQFDFSPIQKDMLLNLSYSPYSLTEVMKNLHGASIILPDGTSEMFYYQTYDDADFIDLQLSVQIERSGQDVVDSCLQSQTVKDLLEIGEKIVVGAGGIEDGLYTSVGPLFSVSPNDPINCSIFIAGNPNKAINQDAVSGKGGG